jgi:phage tail P2-like protein
MLPPNATAQEFALDGATARISDVPVPLRDTWNPDTCPADVLPWLAWAFGVDEWDAGWSDDTKRATIRNAVMIQRRKGSVWSIKQAIKDAGYGDSMLIEGNSNHAYNGADKHNNLITYGDPTAWALYRFVLERPISNTQAAQIRRLLDYIAPARCHLLELIFTEAANLYDGAIRHDGSFNYGVA